MDEKHINNCSFFDVDKRKTILKVQGPDRLLYLWPKDHSGLTTCLFDNEIGWKLNFDEIRERETSYIEIDTPNEENKEESKHH